MQNAKKKKKERSRGIQHLPERHELPEPEASHVPCAEAEEPLALVAAGLQVLGLEGLEVLRQVALAVEPQPGAVVRLGIVELPPAPSRRGEREREISPRFRFMMILYYICWGFEFARANAVACHFGFDEKGLEDYDSSGCSEECFGLSGIGED